MKITTKEAQRIAYINHYKMMRRAAREVPRGVPCGVPAWGNIGKQDRKAIVQDLKESINHVLKTRKEHE